MPQQIKENIILFSQKTGSSLPATMDVVAFSDQEQKMRALKSLLFFWSIAIVCVLIPVAHFILVPAFLITGTIAAKRRWNSAKEGITTEGTCPVCNKPITIHLEKNADLPQWHNCPACEASLELQAESKI